MIKSITEIAKRFFKVNKWITLSSIIGVMISISLVITMIMFVLNGKQSLLQEVETMYGKMDIAVGYNPEQNLVIDEHLSDVLTRQEGVITSTEVILTHLSVDAVFESFYTVGVENDELAKSRYHFTQDIGTEEVSLNKGLAELLGIKTNETITIQGQPYIVKEILPNLEQAGHVTDILLLNREAIAQLEYEKTGINKKADYMMFEVNDKTDIYGLAQTFQQIDTNLRIDIAIEDEFVKSNLDLLFQFMIGLSILVIIITSLFIISNFEIFLYKYKYELAIMRSLGASKWQVFKIILWQSTLINLIGSIFAVVFSFISYIYLQKGFERIFSVSIQTNFQFSIAFFVALISAIIIQFFLLTPAFRSSQLLPVTIMQENEKIDFSYKRLQRKISFSLFGLSVLLVSIGVFFPDFQLFILLGSVGFLLSTITIIPLYLSRWLRAVLLLVRRIFGNISFISIKNTIPQVKKNTFIVLIVSTMMIIVVFGSTFIQTIQKNDEAYIKKQYETDIVMTNRLGDHSTIDVGEMSKKIEQLEHVKSISTQSKQEIGLITGTKRDNYFDYSFADLSDMQKQGLIESSAAIDSTQGLIVKEAYAREHDIKIGDTLNISLQYDNNLQMYLQQGEAKVADIVKRFPYPNEIRDILIDWNISSINSGFTTFEIAYIEVSDSSLALEQLEGLKGIYPEIQVNSLEQSLQQSSEMFKQRWVIFIAVLLVILLSVMFGVINTFINNIHSKRKEFAVLRVIHMSQHNIIQVIMTQVTTYITIGIIFGLFLGFIFTYLVSLVDPGYLSFNFKLITIISILIYLIAFLILIPFAKRIGKLNISEELMQNNK